jgi:phosphatidylglycerophosphate synthase
VSAATEPGALSRALKSVDAWWTVFAVDPIAMRVLPSLLRREWITPNRVTGFAVVLGVASVGCFSTNHLLIGAILYELRFFFDCLDGKIARVRRTSSPAGAIFDRLADALIVPAAFAAIGWNLSQQGHWPQALALLPALMSTVVTVCDLSLAAIRDKDTGDPPTSVEPSSLWVARWSRRHRLTLRPWTVEAETVGLFLGPLIWHGSGLADAELGVCALYGTFVLVDIAFIASAAARLTRHGQAPA